MILLSPTAPLATSKQDTNDSTKYTFDFASSEQLTASTIQLNASTLAAVNTVNDNLASGLFSWTYDATPPTMTITSSTINGGDTTNDETIEVEFTASEDISGFDVNSVTITNATLSNFTGSGSSYSATYNTNRNER